MLLKAFTKQGVPVEFTIADCPVFITSKRVVALFGKQGSELLDGVTIVRGDERTGIFEGDFIELENGEKFTVIYSGGFYMQDSYRSLKRIPYGTHIKVIEGNKENIINCVSNNTIRTELSFGCKGRNIRFTDFVMKVGDCIAVTSSMFLLSPKDIRFATGFQDQSGLNICYGDYYKGGHVVMADGLPYVKQLSGDFVPLINIANQNQTDEGEEKK